MLCSIRLLRRRELVSGFLDFNVLSTAQGHLGTNYTLNILRCQFDRQVIKPQVKSWLTVLDTTKSTANKTKSTQSTANKTKSTQSTANKTKSTQSTANKTKSTQSTANKTKSTQSVRGRINIYISLIYNRQKCFQTNFLHRPNECKTIYQITRICMIHCNDTQ